MKILEIGLLHIFWGELCLKMILVANKLVSLSITHLSAIRIPFVLNVDLPDTVEPQAVHNRLPSAMEIFHLWGY